MPTREEIYDEAHAAATTRTATRIRAITSAPEAKGATHLVEHLAFETNLSAEDALGILKAADVDLANARNQ